MCVRGGGAEVGRRAGNHEKELDICDEILFPAECLGVEELGDQVRAKDDAVIVFLLAPRFGQPITSHEFRLCLSDYGVTATFASGNGMKI